jgi:predicted ribosomally synthesized peptide with SipW-like signal peptide
MWKVYKSAFVIGIVAVAVGGATYAYFADYEISPGNTFAAGAIDLQIDHTKQTYNDIDCATCSVHVVSDRTNRVIAKNGTLVSPFDAFRSIEAGDWADENTLDPGAMWIWGVPTLPAPGDRTEYMFEKKFTWYGPAADVDLELAISGDDTYKAYLNGTLLGSAETGAVWQDIDTYTHNNIGADIVQGQNKLTFVVKNTGGRWAGLLYDLKIDGTCADDYFRQHCSLWGEKNLGAGDTFFNFDDVKPGDRGVNVISLHPDSNPAWVCLSTADEKDIENSNIEPEQSAGDTSAPAGELSPYLKVFAWWDTDADGFYDAGENQIGSTDFGTLGTLALADAGTIGGALPGGQVSNLGLYWCAGDLAAPIAGSVFSCDGEGMGNVAQTDSYTTDMVFYAIQERGSERFSCANMKKDPQADGKKKENNSNKQGGRR